MNEILQINKPTITKSQNQVLKSYSFDEVLASAIEYFNGDELAANVWVNKYAMKDAAGAIFERTPDDMHRRLSKELGRIEDKYPNPLGEEEIFDLIKDFNYLVPQGGPMSGIGNSCQISSLSNCFVIGTKADSYGGIIKMDEEQTQLMKRRGGVGHDLSHIRPKGSPVNNSALTSTGVVPFMERYSNSTREVAQDGRRGALMLTMSVEHPDIEDFIDAKMEMGKVTGANVSVKLTDTFMKAATQGGSFRQQYPIDAKDPIVKREVDASHIWNKIIHNAWKSAEPGVLFWDTILKESIPDCYQDLGYGTTSTNPCGEIPLCPYDSCRLLAVNLFSYVKNPFEEDASFDFVLFARHIQYAQRLMDDIIDLEIEKIDNILDKIDRDPESEELKSVEKNLWLKIRKTCVEGRRTGLGITAEGDMLAALNMKYGSDEAIEFSTKVHKKLALNAYRSSVQLARERGPFIIYDPSREMQNPFIDRIRRNDSRLYDDMIKYGRRNIALLTIAPTGTTSLMTQTTSGIEPAFTVAYKRRRKVHPDDKGVRVDFVDEAGDCWEEYHVFHHKFVQWLEANGISQSEVRTMPDEALKNLVAMSPYAEATANDVDWVQRVKMQGSIQKWVDHSISVTVNVPHDTSEKMVRNIYEMAWKSGCKGCTIYRDGSRSGVLITNDEKSSTDNSDLDQFIETRPPKRPTILDAAIVRFRNNNEKWIAVIGLLNDKPYEIFTGRAEDTFSIPKGVNKCQVVKVKRESVNRYDIHYTDKDDQTIVLEGLSRSFDKEFWNYAKLISGVLRHGMPLVYVIDLIAGLNVESNTINTWKNGVIRALRQYIPNGTKLVRESCKNCGDHEGLVYVEGCVICQNCGNSECG